jgi:hypothetical protein
MVSEKSFAAVAKSGRKRMSFTEIGRQKTVWIASVRNAKTNREL